MYLFPDNKQMKELKKSINPHLRMMEYAWNMFRYPTAGTMAEFYLESEDLDCWEDDYLEEDDADDYCDFFPIGYDDDGTKYGAKKVNWEDI